MHPSLFVMAALAVVQGITEFLPISSDGHLALLGFIFGHVPLHEIILLHGGTLLATVWMFRTELRNILNELTLLHWKESGIFGYGAATIITAIVGLSIEPWVEPFSDNPLVVAAGFLGSALAVFLTRYAKPSQDQAPLSIAKACIVGAFQGLAVLPGLSRSASTICVGMLLGLSGPNAFRFSFILSIPAVAGAVLLDGLKGRMHLPTSIQWFGISLAFVVGLLALQMLRRVVINGRFAWFAAYLVPLALAVALFARSHGVAH